MIEMQLHWCELMVAAFRSTVMLTTAMTLANLAAMREERSTAKVLQFRVIQCPKS